jgi:hypothetical protein
MNLPTFMFGAFTLVALIVSSALLGSSFDILQPDTMALLFDANTGQLKCDTLYGGSRDSSIRRFFVGLGQSFRFKFPLAARTIRFSNSGSAQSPLIVARTSEGAVVTMEIAVQYQLPRNAQRLCDIVYAYGTSYDTFFTNVRAGGGKGARCDTVAGRRLMLFVRVPGDTSALVHQRMSWRVASRCHVGEWD